MKQLVYKLPLGIILFAGMFVGMAKGQDVKQRWVSKMKSRYEDKKMLHKQIFPQEVMLDEIEMLTYHR